MVILLLRKKYQVKKQYFIQQALQEWLVDIILEEQKENHLAFDVPRPVSNLLQKPFAKMELLQELKRLKSSLSGQPGQNIEQLYVQLELDKLSVQSLQSTIWYDKVKGIQELAMMNQMVYSHDILLLTNHPHPEVRMEAQIAMVCFHQYEGLRFFENMRYSLTQWHQLKLLGFLANHPLPAEEIVCTWLQSANASVVQFTLKLIGEQHASNYQHMVIACLGHPEEVIRRQAISCLGEIPSDSSTQALQQVFFAEPNKYLQLAILAEFIRSDEKVDPYFLKELALTEDVDVRLAANKVIFQKQLQENF
ncbi:HEAT repeat domain-containing protein [Pontibacter harenae]|uniref:HEAT repeat domain-containing protein n=1 Tax=Pontibacter harenae TaxID=2894083 RepID=UPI001E4B5106|nr:HEAT repeat domain-containing protein [Pontibacter harenae]MCC9168406.1 HEAT repeat domain-containing protein [Pontibacter harenae]